MPSAEHTHRINVLFSVSNFFFFFSFEKNETTREFSSGGDEDVIVMPGL